MKRILYLGNKLSHHGMTKGVIETLGPQLESEGYVVRYSGTRKNSILRLFEMLCSVLRQRRKTDYVLIDTYSSSAFWYAWCSARLCRIFKIKYIPILHGGNLPHRIQRSRRLSNGIFKYSFANVAVSNYLKEAFMEAGYRVVMIPNNICIDDYIFKRRETFHPKLLWVRSFHKQYNPNMAADVLAMLLKEYPDAELCMVGPDKDGSMAEFKDYCRTLGIADHVKVTGLLSRTEWHKLSEEYDIFINTTNFDNTPVSVIEAMALGLPVVSTNVGGIPFLLSDGEDALLVPKDATEEMVNAIKKILKSKNVAQELAQNARAKAESFSWENVKDKWNNLFSI